MLHDKAQKVKYVLNSHFGGNINSDTPHVTEHVNLLERASPVLTAGLTTNSIICYQGKSIFSLGRKLFSLIPPSNSLILVSDP